MTSKDEMPDEIWVTMNENKSLIPMYVPFEGNGGRLSKPVKYRRADLSPPVDTIPVSREALQGVREAMNRAGKNCYNAHISTQVAHIKDEHLIYARKTIEQALASLDAVLGEGK